MYNPIYKPFDANPRSQYFSNRKALQQSVIRDNFSIATWLVLGGVLQGLASLILPYRNIVTVCPLILLLLYKLAITVLQTYGVIHNPWMEGVIPGRTSIVYPDANTGSYEQKPADRQVCAILLAVRSNHPLGIFAPGFKKIGDYFESMHLQMDSDPTLYGYLGASSWLSATDRGVSSEIMSVVYFESREALQSYAHGPLHTETMEWWRKTEKDLSHIGIMHEVFVAPKKMWEGLYANYHPTGLGATKIQAEIEGIDGEIKKKKVWLSPLVKATGKLRYWDRILIVGQSGRS